MSTCINWEDGVSQLLIFLSLTQSALELGISNWN